MAIGTTTTRAGIHGILLSTVTPVLAALVLTAPATAAQAVGGDGGTDAPRARTLQAAPAVEVTVDGRLDEAAWAAATPARDFVQLVPDEGRAATEPTEVRVLVDDDALYVGARLTDGRPDAIVARLGRRDQDIQADWFYVYVDGYQDRRTAYGFGVSAAGVQRDLRISDDVQRDATWDAVWDAEVRRAPDGWTVEMRIPLSQLRFNRAGEGGWGINFERKVARTNETSHWASMVQGSESFVSRFGDLGGVADLDPRRRVEVVPYTVARLARAPVAAGHPFRKGSEAAGALGADIRVGLGSSLTVSATLNPDFGQVEGDPAVLNLSAFETFQQERRPFFVEGADLFTVAFPMWPPMFYSRRIGRSPQVPAPGAAEFVDRPTATTILGALKLSGKTESGWSIGLLDALTPTERTRWVGADGRQADATAEPFTHYAAARLAREFRDGRSRVGVLATSVNRDLGDDPDLDFLHEDAFAVALDAYHRFAGDRWEARGGVQVSHVRGDTAAILRTQTAPGHWFQRPDAHHVRLDPSRTSLSGYRLGGMIRKIRGAWNGGVRGQITSPGFEVNDLGFNAVFDRGEANGWLRYDRYTPGALLRSWGIGTSAMVQSDLGGRLQSRFHDLGVNAQLLNYWSGNLWVIRETPAWSSTALRGGPALRRPGRWNGGLGLSSDDRAPLVGRGHLDWELEDGTAGRRLNTQVTLTARPSERFDVTLGPSVSLGRQDWQYVGTRPVDGSPRYLVGGLDQRTLGLTTRLDVTASPTLSLQVYARPFVASVRYHAFREVVDPAAETFGARFRTLPVERVQLDGGDVLAVDRDADGTPDFEMADPSFSMASVQMNTVLRWEYRPGSTLFAVWTHDRDAFGRDRLDLGEGVDRLRAAPARNVFMLKVSYWLGR
ncbi:MAG: DUF5916 domain-containing protein [Longimicrobiales bacterium]